MKTMSGHNTNSESGGIETEAEFETALESLLLAASESGIDPVGTWDVRNGMSHPDWEIMVLELAKDDE